MKTYCRKLRSQKQEVLNQSYSLNVKLDDVRDSYIETIVSSEKDPYEVLIINDFLQEVIAFKNDLSFERACVFELRLNGFSYKEIGILLEMTISVVEKHIVEIRKKIKRTNLKVQFLEI